MSGRRRLRFGLLGVFALLLSACASASTGPSTTTTTAPAGPPPEVGLVTLIGTGSSQGNGSSLVALDLSGQSSLRRTVSTGQFPDAVAVAPRLHRAYVTNYDSNTLTPIDLDTGKAGKSIAAGPGPAGIAITPNEKMAYVTDAGGAPIGNTVTPINLKTGRVLAPITVGEGPQGIAITPDGKMAYVTNAGAIVTGQSGVIGHTVTPIDLSTNAALKPIEVGNAPIAIALSPDGSSAYVANEYSGSVTPISVGNDQAGTPISLPGAPEALALSADGSTVWVAIAASSVATGNAVVPIDVSSGAAGSPIGPCKSPSAIAIASGLAYVVCSNSIVPLDLSSRTLEVQQAIAVPGGPYALAITTDKNILTPAKVKKTSSR